MNMRATWAGRTIAAAIAVALAPLAPAQNDGEPPAPTAAERAIVGGSLTAAQRQIEEALLAAPADDHLLFALGVTKFLRSGERLAQAAHRYGASVEGNPILQMVGLPGAPIPQSADPQEISYEQLRSILEAWRDDVAAAEATLARIGDRPVSLRLPVGLIRMDYDADGVAQDSEAMWVLFNRLRTRFTATQEGAEQFVIAFDRGDVNWLRGYCHICLAVGELILAHDFRELFERCGQLAFARPKTPYPFLLTRVPDEHEPFLDMIAAVHLLNFEVVDPAGMERVRQHLLSAIGQSRAMWTWYDQETDNDHEWVPNPRQTAIIPRAEVTDDMRAMWITFLGEAEEVLEGERLVRFWRPSDTRGVNLKRVFTEPRRFDLVLWVQGTAAAPYLEQGQTTSPRLWDRMERAFGYHVFRHGFWFN